MKRFQGSLQASAEDHFTDLAYISIFLYLKYLWIYASAETDEPEMYFVKSFRSNADLKLFPAITPFWENRTRS